MAVNSSSIITALLFDVNLLDSFHTATIIAPFGSVGKLESARQDRERIGNIKKVFVVICSIGTYLRYDRLARFGGHEFSDAPHLRVKDVSPTFLTTMREASRCG